MALRFTNTTAGDATAAGCVVDESVSDLTALWAGGASVSMWLFIDSTGAGSSSYLDMDEWQLRQSGTRIRLNHEFSSADGEWRTTASGSVPNGTWVHVIITYDSDSDANDPIFYVDGVVESSNEQDAPSGTATTSTAPRLIIGNSVELTRTVDGLMADVLIHDRILTAAEAAETFHQAGVSVPVDGLIRRYKMSPFLAGVIPGTPCRTSGRTIAAASTDIDVDVPEHVDGERLVMVVACSGVDGTAPNITTPSGWTLAKATDAASGAATQPTMSMFTREADTEGSTVTVTSDVGAQGWLGYMMNMGQMTLTVDASATATGTSTSPSSPAVTPSDDSVLIHAALVDEKSWGAGFLASRPPDISVFNMDEENAVTLGVGFSTSTGSTTTAKIWTASASRRWGGMTVAFLHGAGDEGFTVKGYSPEASHATTYTALTGDDDILNAIG